MLIDAHNHPFWLGMTPKRMVENMDRYGIAQCWLLSCETPKEECRDGELLTSRYGDGAACNMSFLGCVEYVQQYPNRFILGYAPDPRLPDAIQRLQRAIDDHNVRICGEIKYRMRVDDASALRLYRFCGERNLPVILHLQRPISIAEEKQTINWYGGSIEHLEQALKLCPQTVFIGHAQSFWAEISGDGKAESELRPTGKIVPNGKLLKLLERYSNLYCDISAESGRVALSRDPDFAVQFLTAYADRILFARDNIGYDHQALLNSYCLPESVLDKICYQNAQKLIKK